MWDEKAAQDGIDKPRKRDDHSIDSARYGLFSHFGHFDKLQETNYRQAVHSWNRPGFDWRDSYRPI
jgi:hypothetical protein